MSKMDDQNTEDFETVSTPEPETAKVSTDKESEIPEQQETVTEEPTPETTGDDEPDISQLTDAQLEEYEKTGKLPEKETAPETSPDKDTEEKETAEKVESAEKTETPLYAGKYKTTDELLKGAQALADKLALNNPAVAAVLAAAKETGEFKTVEKLYKQLEVEMGRQTSTTKTTSAPSAPAQDTAQGIPNDVEIAKAVGDLTYSQLLATPLAQMMQARGLSIPKNAQEFEALIDVHPYFAAQFESQFREAWNKNLTEIRGHAEALKQVGHSNEQAVNADIKSIREFAAKYGIELQDEQVEQIKQDVVASPFSYEDRHGVKFLRPGALKDHFIARYVPDHIEKVATQKLAEGRKQAVEDIEKNKKATVRSISTTGKTSRDRVVDKPVIDLNDPDQVSLLTDEQLEHPEKFFKVKK